MRQLIADLASQPIRNLCPNPGCASTTSWNGISASLLAESGRLKVTSTTTSISSRAAAVVVLAEIKPNGIYTVSAEAEFVSAKGTAWRVRFYNSVTTETSIFTVASGLVAPFTSRRFTYTATVLHSFDRVYLEFTTTVAGQEYVTGDVAGYVDNVMVVAGQLIGGYGDGDTLGWRWLGAPGASESVGYPEPAGYIRNRHPNPAAENNTLLGWSSNNGTNYPIAIETDPALVRSGIQAVRSTRGGTATSTVSSAFMNTGSLTSWKVKPGETVYASVFVRAELAGRQGQVRLSFRDISGTPIGTFSGPLTAIPVGAYGLLSFSSVVPAGADSAIALIDTSPVTGLATIGERIWMDDGMLVNGGPTDYANGNYPGWRWDGVANRSESVGPPYKLDSIAGPPLATVSVPGTQSAATNLGPYEGRTLYVVHDTIDTVSENYSLAYVTVGGVGEGGMIIRTRTAGSNFFETRAQNVGGSIQTPNVVGARTVGRHVTVGSLSDGATSVVTMIDGTLGTPQPLTAANGQLANPVLGLGAVGPSDIPIYAIAYRGEHDATTKKRVTAWLARRYGSTIPAGY